MRHHDLTYAGDVIMWILAVTSLCWLTTAAYGQADTVRRARIVGVLGVTSAPRKVISDSAQGDIETVQVLHVEAVYGGMDPVKRQRMVDSLTAQRRIWEGHRPRSYVIRVLEDDGCIHIRAARRRGGQAIGEQLVVRDSVIVRRQDVPLPAFYQQRCSFEWRVDDLFADLAQALADKRAAVLDLQYDPAYGFPRRYVVIRGGGSDGGHSVLVESFAPVP